MIERLFLYPEHWITITSTLHYIPYLSFSSNIIIIRLGLEMRIWLPRGYSWIWSRRSPRRHIPHIPEASLWYSRERWVERRTLAERLTLSKAGGGSNDTAKAQGSWRRHYSLQECTCLPTYYLIARDIYDSQEYRSFGDRILRSETTYLRTWWDAG